MSETSAEPAGRRQASELPAIRRIAVGDLKRVLGAAWTTFLQKPSHLFVLYLIYPVIALILSRLVFGYGILPILFPLAGRFRAARPAGGDRPLRAEPATRTR